MSSAFETLNAVNVNDRAEDKDGLTYLSWAWAWAEVKKIYPDAEYTIYKSENGLPYVYDENTGYMVYTTVTIEGITHEMWLPVMDSKNKAMKNKPYTYKTKYGDKSVEAATMFDVNKAIMRCLTKNLAMHGLGLYIYAGEDLPESEETPKTTKEVIAENEEKNDRAERKISAGLYKELTALIESKIPDAKTRETYIKGLEKGFEVNSLKDINMAQLDTLKSKLVVAA